MPIGFEDPFCKACGAQGVSRGTVARRLAHVPVGWRPTQLVVRLRRFGCTRCRRVWRQDTSTLAEPRARLTRAAVEWGLRALALECMSVSRVARTLGISWHTANNAILASAQATLLDDPHRFDGVEVLGVDEHVWRHTRRGDRYVTVIIDLTPVRHRSGPARLLDVVPGRSKKVLKTWLSQRDQEWRGRVEVVAMDGFTGSRERRRRSLSQHTISTSLIPRLASSAHTWAQNLAPSLAWTQMPRTCLIPSMSTPTAICAALLVT